jgi:hypothetical protein
MNLIYYIYAIAANLRGDPDLLGEGPYIIDRIVGGCIQFVYTVGTVLVEGQAGFTGIAGFSGIGYVLAIDGLGKYPGTGGLPHPSGSAEQIGVTQEIVLNGVPECCGDGRLTHHIGKTCRSVLSCRYNKFIHMRLLR